MRTDGPALIMLMAAAGLCATLAGCANGTGGHASAPAGHVTPPPPASTPVTATSGGTPAAQTSHPAVAAGSPSHPGTSSQPAFALLTSGLYTNAPDGTPHYVLSFTARANGDFRGSASFLYQDGRVATVGSYAGTLSRGGKISLTLGGRVLSGSYAAGQLTLAGCAAALPLATASGDCTFAYHGHVP